MRFFHITILLVSTLLVFYGCARKTHHEKAKEAIVPYGKGLYAVSYGGINPGAVQAIVRRAANEYCRDMGKEMEPVKERNLGISVELQFKCEN